MGSFALIIGIVALLSRKGRRWHKKSGSTYLIVMIVVLVTGFIGAFIFKKNLFLLMVTIIAGYAAF